jgi:hypothetical protein
MHVLDWSTPADHQFTEIAYSTTTPPRLTSPAAIADEVPPGRGGILEGLLRHLKLVWTCLFAITTQ